MGSLRDRQVACSASDRQGSNFASCVLRTLSSQSSHHPQEVLLAQFSLYVHKGGLKPDSFHFFTCPYLNTRHIFVCSANTIIDFTLIWCSFDINITIELKVWSWLGGGIWWLTIVHNADPKLTQHWGNVSFMLNKTAVNITEQSLSQRCFYVGPSSSTLGQHKNNMVVCWWRYRATYWVVDTMTCDTDSLRHPFTGTDS